MELLFDIVAPILRLPFSIPMLIVAFSIHLLVRILRGIALALGALIVIVVGRDAELPLASAVGRRARRLLPAWM